MIVLDTNVISEALRPSPAPRIGDWLRHRPLTSLFITATTQAEILYGIGILPAGRRRDDLQAAAHAMFSQNFGGRILAFDEDAARWFAVISADRRQVGRPISQFDAQIAAITRAYGAALATRNVRDFEDCGIELVNPWDGG